MKSRWNTCLKIILISVCILLAFGTIIYAENKEPITGLRYDWSGEKCIVHWNVFKNLTAYEVQIREEGEEDYRIIGEPDVSGVSINGMQKGKTYYLRVIGFVRVNGQKEYKTDFSEPLEIKVPELLQEQTADLGKVQNLKVVNLDKKERTAQVTWDKLEGADGYEISVNPNETEFKVLGEVLDNKATFNNCSRGVYYAIRVRAFVIKNGEKHYSNEYSDTVQIVIERDPLDLGDDDQGNGGDSSNEPTTPGIVSGLKVDIDNNDVTFTWDRLDGVAGYWLCITTPDGSNLNYTTSETTIKVTNFFQSSKSYYVKVRAYVLEPSGRKLYGEYSAEEEFKRGDGQKTNVNIGTVTGLTVDVDLDEAKFDWNKVEGADGYQLTLIYPGIGELNYDVPNGMNTKTLSGFTRTESDHVVKVRAYVNDKNGRPQYGEYSQPVTFRPEKNTLAKVTGLEAKVSGTNVTFTWNKVAGADGYQIDMVIPGIYTYTWYSDTNTTKTNGIEDYRYSYTTKVRAYTGTKDRQTATGEFSDPVEVYRELAQVKNLKVNVTNNTTVVYSWDEVEGAKGYILNENGTEVTYKNSVLTIKNGRVTTSAVSNHATGTFKVKVKAYIDNNVKTGSGAYSEEKQFTISTPSANPPSNPTPNPPSNPTPNPPSKVTGVTVQMFDKMAKLSWNAVSGAQGYEIKYNKVGASEADAITKTTTGNSYSIPNLVHTTSGYTAQIRAYKASNNKGPWSDEIVFNVINAPQGVNAVVSGTTVTTSWNKVNDADGYEVSVSKVRGTSKSYSTQALYYINVSTIYYNDLGYSITVRAYKYFSPGLKSYSGYSERKLVSGDIPEPITGLKQTDNGGTGKYPKITWNQVSGSGIMYEVETVNGVFNSQSIHANTATIYSKDATRVRVRAYYTSNGNTYRGSYAYLTIKNNYKTDISSVTGIRKDGMKFTWDEVLPTVNGRIIVYDIMICKSSGEKLFELDDYPINFIDFSAATNWSTDAHIIKIRAKEIYNTMLGGTSKTGAWTSYKF